METTTEPRKPRKSRKPRKKGGNAAAKADQAFLLQCMQGFLNREEAGVKLPSQIDSPADASKLAQSIMDYQADKGSILATMGAFFVKTVAEMLMESELTAHLGYEKYERLQGQPKETHEIDVECPSEPLEEGKTTQGKRNYRNGSYKRKLHTPVGTLDLNCPRDRNGTFSSQCIPGSLKDVAGLQEKLLEVVAQGNDLRSTAVIMEKIMGVDISHEYVRMTVENFSQRLHAWQNRQLKPFYPFLFIDCLYVPFRDEKLVSRNNKRPVYVVLGIDPSGRKELVHLEMRGASESKQDWVNIFDGLRSRGLEEILFVSMDGVTGVADGLKVIFPKARTFRCIVHMIRNSCQHISYKQRKEWCADIKPLYSSPDLPTAEVALRDLESKWSASCPAAVKFWQRNFDEFVVPLYSVTSSIRKVIYTTNAVESLNSSLRKVVQKGTYSSEQAILTCMLLRCQKGLADNWNRLPIHNWAKIREELMAFEGWEEVCAKYLQPTSAVAC